MKKFSELSDEVICNNRFFIGNIFIKAQELIYIIDSDLFSFKEKEWLFYKSLIETISNTLNKEEKDILEKIFSEDVRKETFLEKGFEGVQSSSFGNIFNKFLLLFENENLAWIFYLHLAEKIEPNNIQVLNYLLAYANAIEDESLIEEYSSRLKNIEIAG